MAGFPTRRARDLDLWLGHTAYRRASLINLYLCAKFHWNRKKTLWTEGRIHGRIFDFIRSILSKSLAKMETRHSLEGRFGSEFPAICNHCRVMVAWYCETWKFCEQFLRFFGKMTPFGKIFKILYWKYSPPHQSMLCSNDVKFVRREIGEVVH